MVASVSLVDVSERLKVNTAVRVRQVASRSPAALAIAMLVLIALGTTSVLASSADVDGDGSPDTVSIISGGQATPSTLEVRLATGTVLTAPAGEGLPPAQVLRIRNVDGRRGGEIFARTAHISTDDTITVYAYAGRRLVVAGQLLAFGGDFDYRFGFNCVRVGPFHEIVSHFFSREMGSWSRADTVYVWRNGLLVRHRVRRAVALSGAPPRREVGVGC